jgi:uncharacterized protein (TIGR01244 family)
MSTRFALLTTFAAIALAQPISAQQVTKEAVSGITNFARLETTVACGGATTPQAVPELKKMGFASIINLRLADERGANIDEEAAAAKAAGINFIHLPLSVANPDPTVVDRFLAAVTNPANNPAYIHCGGGSRAAAMWMIKRVEVDKWDEERAMKEAEALGLANPTVKDFAVNYIHAHK